MNVKKFRLGVTLSFAALLQMALVLPSSATSTNTLKVESRDQIYEHLIGKQLAGRSNTFIFNEDFTFEATYNGAPILGRWMWIDSEDRFCMETQIPSNTFTCRSVVIKTGANGGVFFERNPVSNGRRYLRNPYPRLWSALSYSN